MDTKSVGEKLVALCNEGKNLEAVAALYDKDIVSVEPQGSPEMPAEMRGIDAIRGKNEWWIANHEVHSGTADGPYPHGDRFAVIYDYDVTLKTGPQAGHRFQMKEVAMYTVANGKIVREEFHYKMG
jgi:ketosteroid isomerase-like protein